MLCKRDICKHIGIKTRYICRFDDYSPAAKDLVPLCARVRMTLFRNVYVHVQKTDCDKYQCNVMDKRSAYFQCPVTKRILIMQNDVFIIIMICEVNTVHDFIKFCFKLLNYHRLTSNWHKY